MAEDRKDSWEKVMHDLDLLEIDDLRIMARQNDLQFDGTRAELLSRIKVAFGFENEKVDIEAKTHANQNNNVNAWKCEICEETNSPYNFFCCLCQQPKLGNEASGNVNTKSTINHQAV